LLTTSLIAKPDNSPKADGVPNWDRFFLCFDYPNLMKRSELTNKQKLSVPCPVCAAAVGERCQLYSGLGLRKEAHTERKFYAIEALEHYRGHYNVDATGYSGEYTS
jgi:hypothetical protein